MPNITRHIIYGSHLIEEVPLTLEELSCHNNVQRDVCRPFRPHPRVGVFGSSLQQEIANLSKNCVCVWDSLLPIDLEWPKGHHHLTGIEMKIMMSVRKWINHRTSLARRQKCVKLTEIQMILLQLVTGMRISEADCSKESTL